MLKQTRTLCRSLLALSLGLALTLPATAQDSPTTIAQKDTQGDPPAEPDEEPELPPDQLVLPEDDPDFEPDPNAPLEEDFLRMRPTVNPLYWRVELREQPGWTNNVDQIANGPASISNRLSLTGLLRYTLPTQTQVLLRSQAFLFNYPQVTERDQFLAIPLSITGSQWLFNNLNLYAGYIPILSSSIGRTQNVQRIDHDVMAGAAWYQPIDGGHYFFGGYQFDYLAAGLDTVSNLGNLFFAGYRHRFSDDLFLFADARVQPRGYTSTPEFFDELRAGGGLALQWKAISDFKLAPGISSQPLILEARGDYNHIVNFISSDRSAGIFSFGINLITAIQSES